MLNTIFKKNSYSTIRTHLCSLLLGGLSLFLASTYCVAKTKTHLNGLETFYEFEKPCFLIAFYSETITKETNTLFDDNLSRKIEIRVAKKKLFTRRFREMWIDNIAVNNNDTLREKLAKEILYFTRLFHSSLTLGDTIEVIYSPKKSVKVKLNDSVIGEIGNNHFFNLILNTLVGPVPLSQQIKKAMLAGGIFNIPEENLIAYKRLKPTPYRIEIAKTWKKAAARFSAKQSKATEKVTVKTEIKNTKDPVQSKNKTTSPSLPPLLKTQRTEAL